MKAAGWKIVIGTCLPRTTGKAGFEADRIAINTWLRANYTTFADGLADVGGDATIGAPGANLNTTYYSDGVHLTAAGYQIAAPIFQTPITTILAG